MQTYSAESIPSQWPALLGRIAKGEEILITEQERPVARLVPVAKQIDWDYLKELESLRGIAPGIDPIVERDEDRV